jgi:hypothetical protein
LSVSVDSLDVKICSDAEWEALVATSPHGSAFSSHWFIDALGLRKEYWAVFYRGRPVLGTPLLFDGDQPIAELAPFTMYIGPVLSTDISKQPPHRRLPLVIRAFSSLFGVLTQNYDRLAFSLHYCWDDLRGLSWYNYHTPERGRFALSTYYTGVLTLAELTDEAAWLSKIRTSRRQDVDKARRAGLTCSLSDDIDLLIRLYRATFERQQITVSEATLTTLCSIATSALRMKSGFINVCHSAVGGAVSAYLIVYDMNCAYYLVGANDPIGRSSGAGALLMTDCLRRCHEMGLKNFDFVGINSPRRGDFKTSFNAAPRAYVDASWRRPA